MSFSDDELIEGDCKCKWILVSVKLHSTPTREGSVKHFYENPISQSHDKTFYAIFLFIYINPCLLDINNCLMC